MVQTVSATELQRNARSVIDRARIRGEAVIVESYGKPMAALLPFEEYRQYLRYKEEQRAARRTRLERLAEAAIANAAYNGLDPDEAAALAERARQEVHDSRVGRSSR